MTVNRHMVKGVTKLRKFAKFLRKIAQFQSSLEKSIKMLFDHFCSVTLMLIVNQFLSNCCERQDC